MIMRFRPANISLINRRHYLPRLLLTLSSFEKNNQRTLTGHYISTSGEAVTGSEPDPIKDITLATLARRNGSARFAFAQIRIL
jgi:hypothetical protein